MVSLMQRRREMMKAASAAAPILLVNGSYDSGKVVVTNGKDFTVTAPTIWAYVAVSFTQSFSVSAGDVICIEFVDYSAAKNINFGFYINGTATAHSRTKPNADTWYEFPISSDGTVSAVFVRARESGWNAAFTLSVRKNSEVLF